MSYVKPSPSRQRLLNDAFAMKGVTTNATNIYNDRTAVKKYNQNSRISQSPIKNAVLTEDADLRQQIGDAKSEIQFWKQRYEIICEENIRIKEQSLDIEQKYNQNMDAGQYPISPQQVEKLRDENYKLQDSIRALRDGSNSSKEIEDLRFQLNQSRKDLKIMNEQLLNNESNRLRSPVQNRFNSPNQSSPFNREGAENKVKNMMSIFNDNLMTNGKQLSHIEFIIQGVINKIQGQNIKFSNQMIQDLNKALDAISISNTKNSETYDLGKQLLVMAQEKYGDIEILRDKIEDQKKEILSLMKTHELEIKLQQEKIVETLQDHPAVFINQPRKYTKQENCHIDYLEQQLAMKVDLIGQLRKRIEKNETNMKQMAVEYKQHLNSSFTKGNATPQRYKYEPDQHNAGREDLVDQLRKELQQKDSIIDQFKIRNSQQIGQQSPDGMVCDPEEFVDQKMHMKRSLMKINEYEKQKMNYLKDKKQQIDFLIRVGTVIQISQEHLFELQHFKNELMLDRCERDDLLQAIQSVENEILGEINKTNKGNLLYPGQQKDPAINYTSQMHEQQSPTRHSTHQLLIDNTSSINNQAHSRNLSVKQSGANFTNYGNAPNSPQHKYVGPRETTQDNFFNDPIFKMNQHGRNLTPDKVQNMGQYGGQYNPMENRSPGYPYSNQQQQAQQGANQGPHGQVQGQNTQGSPQHQGGSPQGQQLIKPQKVQLQQAQFPCQGSLKVSVVSASNLFGTENKGKSSNSYCKITVNRAEKKTKVIDSINPNWNETFEFPINVSNPQDLPQLSCDVYDHNTITAEVFLGGQSKLNVQEAIMNPNQTVPISVQLQANGVHAKSHVQGQVQLVVMFSPKPQQPQK